jgi:hypothetical protein
VSPSSPYGTFITRGIVCKVLYHLEGNSIGTDNVGSEDFGESLNGHGETGNGPDAAPPTFETAFLLVLLHISRSLSTDKNSNVQIENRHLESHRRYSHVS